MLFYKINWKRKSATCRMYFHPVFPAHVNMNNTEHDNHLSAASKTILSSWYGLTGLGAIIGNGVVLWLFTRKRSLRSISNSFLSSLAAADLLVGFVILPVWISIRYTAYDVDRVQTYGKAIDILWIHTTVATTFNLCCVTLDRHIAIFHPLRYEDILTFTRCYILIATVWFLSVVLPCSRFLVKDEIGLSTLYIPCTIITVLIPMIIIVLCSTRILKAASVQCNQISVHTVQNQDAVKRRKKNFKAAMTISIVVGLFVVCWLPSLITSLVHHLSGKFTFTKLWAPVEAVAFTSSAINPWVYCLRNEEFNEALTHTFRFLKRRNSEQNGFDRSVERSTIS